MGTTLRAQALGASFAVVAFLAGTGPASASSPVVVMRVTEGGFRLH